MPVKIISVEQRRYKFLHSGSLFILDNEKKTITKAEANLRGNALAVKLSQGPDSLSTGNSCGTEGSESTENMRGTKRLLSLGGEFGGELMHTYVWLSPSAVHLKLSQDIPHRNRITVHAVPDEFRRAAGAGIGDERKPQGGG